MIRSAPTSIAASISRKISSGSTQDMARRSPRRGAWPDAARFGWGGKARCAIDDPITMSWGTGSRPRSIWIVRPVREAAMSAPGKWTSAKTMAATLSPAAIQITVIRLASFFMPDRAAWSRPRRGP